MSMTVNKVIDPTIPVSLKVLIRAIFGWLFFSPIIFKNGCQVFISNRPSWQVRRVLLMTLAMGATYFTYTHLPFTLAISIGFTGPIFTAVLAYFILKDRLTVGQWIAIFMGYLGVLWIVKPQGSINEAVYVAIIGNIVTGLGLIYTKKLTRIDGASTIIVLGSIGIILTTFLWSILYWLGSAYGNPFIQLTWVWPTWKDIQLLIVMGLLGTISQLSSIQALKYASPSFLSFFEYSRLVIAIPIGLALGEKLPSYQEIIGILIILSATIYHLSQGRYQANQK